MTKSSFEAQKASAFVAQGKQLPKYKNGGNRFDSRKQTSLDSASSGWVEQDANMLFKTGNYLFSIPVHGKTDDYTITIQIDKFLDKLNQALAKSQFSVPTFQKVLMAAISTDDIKASCTCPDWAYRFGHAMTLSDDNAGRPEARPAPITNPNNQKGCCKHILYVLSNKLWTTKVARTLFNYIVDIWKNKKQLFDRIIRPALNDITDEKILSKPEKVVEQPTEQPQAQDQAAQSPDGEQPAATDGAHESYEGISVEQRAVDMFGVTYQPAFCGYVLRDGRMLDFSAGQGRRVQDHREIGKVYTDETFEYTSDAIVKFVHDTGAIRVDYQSGSIEIDVSFVPTDKQYDRLTYFIRKGDRCSLDFSDGSRLLKSYYFDEKSANYVRVLNVIRHYFNTGKFAEDSAATEAVNSYYDGKQVFDEDQEFALSICREIGADVQPYVTPENTPEQIEELGQAYKNGLPAEVLVQLTDPLLSYKAIEIIARAYTKNNVDLLPYKTFAPDALEQILRGKLLGVPLDKIALKGFNSRQIEQLVRAYKISPALYNKICDRSISYNRMRDIIAGRK
ncbi:MAG: SWIM zinc finger family protein [Acetobacter sp.]|nr:SWIM zinc finger family protein [Acetobacter sp.]